MTVTAAAAAARLNLRGLHRDLSSVTVRPVTGRRRQSVQVIRRAAADPSRLNSIRSPGRGRPRMRQGGDGAYLARRSVAT